MTDPDLPQILDRITAQIAAAPDRGRAARYIPELADIDTSQFGIAVAPVDGPLHAAGDADTAFSVQSVSKVFTLTLALETLGQDLWTRLGKEPSGDPFNSIIQLEAERGVPRNPFINAGAIVLADVVLGAGTAADALARIKTLVCDLTGAEIQYDPAVAASEARTGFRNRALANFMAAEGNLKGPVDAVLDVYFTHCALAMTCRQLACAGRFLADAGMAGPRRIATAARVRQINALMLTCGHYDGSGEFAYRVGIPGKSGVGGGILAVVPGIASIATWCPGLGAKGNSLLGTRAMELLARETGWSVFGPLD